MNSEMKKDLRAQHFKVGYGGTTYETAEKERQRTLTENVHRRRAEILATTVRSYFLCDIPKCKTRFTCVTYGLIF